MPSPSERPGMRVRPFGQVQVPVVGQGTWRMERDDRGACVAALRRGVERGLTHVDTAELYGGGVVEELVAEALETRRADLFLVSKVVPSHASRGGTIAACEASLRRLRTDRLDAYLLHWPGRHPLGDTLGAMEDLVRGGKILAFGVSNFDVPDLEEAWRLAPGRIACNQVLYHLGERGIEHRVLPWCKAHGVTVVAYSPFGAGAFPTPRSPGGRVLAELAAARNATPRQVALAFLARDPAVLVIPKAASPVHVDDNAGAGDLVLTAAEIGRVDAAFPSGPPPRSLPTI